MVFVLVHSPVVGPGSWMPVARDLDRRGHHALVPWLLGTGEPSPRRWQDDVQAVCDALKTRSEPIILVGHSASGVLLPVIADAVAAPVSGLIFVDSDVPAQIGETPMVPPSILDRVRELAVDDILPPWPTWWDEEGENVMRFLVPDETVRTALVREMPSLPLAYLEQRIPSPPGWDHTPCSYLLLSEAYAGAAAEARKREWQVEKIRGAQHLHAVVAPTVVSAALIRLARA